MLWWEGLIQQAKTIAHLCRALPQHCHAGRVSEGHKEQATAQLYFHRRRCKPDGLKEHYTLDLAGRLVIYNNKFAVKEHRGLMSFPYFKETPFPHPNLFFFSFWLSARILQHLSYNPNWASQLAWQIVILLDNYETQLIGFQSGGEITQTLVVPAYRVIWIHAHWVFYRPLEQNWHLCEVVSLCHKTPVAGCAICNYTALWVKTSSQTLCFHQNDLKKSWGEK